MKLVPSALAAALAAAAAAAAPPATAALSALPPSVQFSWDTLPVFFHSANASGPWNDEAVARIAKFAMATFEKDHAHASGGGASQETLTPEACRRVSAASNGTTATVYYLNSAIDWPDYQLHQEMLAHPEYRLKDHAGDDVIIVGQLAFNHSVAALREMWVADCSAAVDAGCDGCFIDRSNNLTVLNVTMPLAPGQAAAYAASHMGALDELNTVLAAKPNGGAFAINNNEGAAGHQTMAMLEDFAASERCIQALQQLVRRGLGVQAHAGDLPDGQGCASGDVNAMAAFLVGAGEFSYYHCAATWASDPSWPAAPDPWLDWLPEYDQKLGQPVGDGAKGADGVWRRSFRGGVAVEFDPNTNNGTIHWSDGTVARGTPLVPPLHQGAQKGGCKWITL